MNRHPVGSFALLALYVLGALWVPCVLPAQSPTPAAGDTVSFRFIDADLRAVVQGIGRYLDKPLLSVGIPSTRVTLETPQGVSRATLGLLLRGLVEQQGLELTEDSVAWRVRPKPQEQVTALGRAPGQQAEGPPQLFVIRLKHARSSDIAASINQLFGASGEMSGRTGIGRSSLSDQLRAPPGAAPAPAAPAPNGGHNAALAGSVTIVPDELTNSLMIRATAEDFDVIKGAVDELDIRPLQVLIEILIVEARTDRSFSFGAGVTVPQQSVGDGTVGGSTQGPSGLGDVVVRFMNMGRGDVSGFVTAAQSKGEVEILSRPVLIAANNTEARFLVGSQRPFISSSRQLPTDQPQADQVTSYRDVGTKVTVIPTINYDGYVSLEILQEISQATDEVQFSAPVISTREAHTQLLVKDGQTIVIGGMRDRQRDRGSRGVPLLSSLPLIGGFFGAATRRTTETELFIFLTPRILRTDEDIDRATTERMPERAKEGR